MSYLGVYQAEFGQTILANVQTVLERDTEAHIREIDETLDLFKDFKTPGVLMLNFPALHLTLAGSRLAQAEDDSHIREEHTLFVDVAVVGSERDAHTIQKKLIKYVLAVDRALRRMTVTDLTGGVTDSITRPAWEVTDHQFGNLRGDDKLPLIRQDARLVLAVQFSER